MAATSVAFPPLAHWLLRYLRKKKAHVFENYITKGTHFFLRGPRAQALLESVKCGYDDKYSLAYIDILCPRASRWARRCCRCCWRSAARARC